MRVKLVFTAISVDVYNFTIVTRLQQFIMQLFFHIYLAVSHGLEATFANQHR